MPRRLWILSTKDRLLLQAIGAVFVLAFLVKDIAHGNHWLAAVDVGILVWSAFEIRRLVRRLR